MSNTQAAITLSVNHQPNLLGQGSTLMLQLVAPPTGEVWVTEGAGMQILSLLASGQYGNDFIEAVDNLGYVEDWRDGLKKAIEDGIYDGEDDEAIPVVVGAGNGLATWLPWSWARYNDRFIQFNFNAPRPEELIDAGPMCLVSWDSGTEHTSTWIGEVLGALLPSDQDRFEAGVRWEHRRYTTSSNEVDGSDDPPDLEIKVYCRQSGAVHTSD